MTYFDVRPGFSELERRLGDAVYGASMPDQEQVLEYLRKFGIQIPFWVVAVHGATTLELFRPLSGHRFLPLRLHTGVEYLCFNGDTYAVAERLATVPLLSGDFARCDDHKTWHGRIQNCVSTLREKEIDLLYGPGKYLPNLNTQVQAQHLALLAIRGEWEGNSEDWWEPVAIWLRIVLMHHRSKLNNSRRRMLELMVDALRDLDNDPVIAFRFQRAVERIYSVYNYTDIEPMFKEVLSDIRPYLLLQRKADLLPDESAPLSTVVQDALRFMRLRFQEDIGLAEVASAACVTPAHLARLFRQQTSRTVTEHLHLLRIDHAKILLTDTDDPLPIIAAESGFLSVKHFHHIFRRLTDTTPTTFRQQYRRRPKR